MNLYIRDQAFGSPSTEVPSSLPRDLDTAIPPSKDPGTNPSFPHNLDSGTSLITRFPSVTSPENLRYRGPLISIRIQSPRPQEDCRCLGVCQFPKVQGLGELNVCDLTSKPQAGNSGCWGASRPSLKGKRTSTSTCYLNLMYPVAILNDLRRGTGTSPSLVKAKMAPWIGVQHLKAIPTSV